MEEEPRVEHPVIRRVHPTCQNLNEIKQNVQGLQVSKSSVKLEVQVGWKFKHEVSREARR
jgi:hypothetical protein